MQNPVVLEKFDEDGYYVPSLMGRVNHDIWSEICKAQDPCATSRIYPFNLRIGYLSDDTSIYRRCEASTGAVHSGLIWVPYSKPLVLMQYVLKLIASALNLFK